MAMARNVAPVATLLCADCNVRAMTVVVFTGARANGTSLRRLSPVKVIMAGRKGCQKDTTSALSRAGAFHDTWLRSS